MTLNLYFDYSDKLAGITEITGWVDGKLENRYYFSIILEGRNQITFYAKNKSALDKIREGFEYFKTK